MKLLITGAEGFIAKNLRLHLSTKENVEVLYFSRDHDAAELKQLLEKADFIFHLAGVNRPINETEFFIGNTDLTRSICEILTQLNKSVPIIYTSSIQADLDNLYGQSKKAAETALLEYARQSQANVMIYRLPNVFGKWCKPNYNSVVATFCHRVSQGLPVEIHNEETALNLVYIDDVISNWLRKLDPLHQQTGFIDIQPIYHITVGQLAKQLFAFSKGREDLISENVGTGLVRALYSTYISYLHPSQFAYTVPQYQDDRGAFVEMLKTKEAGQFSFFTAHPGITRGGHYHHSKTEKFLVIKGKACFRFRHMISGEFFELHTEGGQAKIVETIPGWTHDITNIGDDEMIVMLWANEIFDRQQPDTYAMPVGRN